MWSLPTRQPEWTYPPFEGRIVDGFIWGRGTLDIKNQLIGIMEAAEKLLNKVSGRSARSCSVWAMTKKPAASMAAR